MHENWKSLYLVVHILNASHTHLHNYTQLFLNTKKNFINIRAYRLNRFYDSNLYVRVS